MRYQQYRGLLGGITVTGLRVWMALHEGSLKVRMLCGVVMHGPFDTSTAQGRSQERLRRIILTAGTSAIARVLAVATPLITVRLTMGYLGKEVYGLWMTITSFFALLAFADLGLGSGLHTTLSQTYGAGDLLNSRRLTSTTFLLLLAISAAVVLVFGLAYPFVPWARVLHAVSPHTAALAAALVAVIFLPQVVNIPLATVQRTQMALQDGFCSNLWQCVASVTSLGAVVVCVHARVNPIVLVLAVSSVGVTVTLANWCWFFLRHQSELRPGWSAYSPAMARRLLRTGLAFFGLSILTTVGLAVDNLIVAHLCGLKEVATFSVAARTAALLSVAATMISMPLWAANGEALAHGDVDWVRRNTARMAVVSVIITLGGGMLLVALGPWVFRFWLGPTFEVGRLLLLGLAGRELCLSVASPYFMVLNGAGSVLKQIEMFALFTPISILAKVGAVHLMGVSGVPWAMAFCYGLLILPRVTKTARAIYTTPGVQRK